MANHSIEAIDVIEESRLSKFEISKFKANPYMLGFSENCRFHGKPLCVRKHSHCENDFSGNHSNISCWDDIPKDNMPGSEVLKSLMLVVKENSEQGFPAVRWDSTPEGESYTRADIRLMYNLMSFVDRQKKSLKMEKEMVNNGENPPTGLSDLSRLQSCQSFYDILWHSPIQSNRVDIIPSDDPDVGVRINKDNIQIYNAERTFSIVKLDSESLTEMARLDGEVTTQIADHFVNLIQVDDPSNTFIHIDYTKDTYQKRTIHATELGLGLDSIGWTFLLINRGGNNANTVKAYHWVIGAFSPAGACFFGDSLPGPLPTNFRTLLEPYYRARFPGCSMPNIYNCSREIEFPNYPTQRGDGYICGYVCLLVMITAKEEKLIRCIFSSNRISPKITFVKHPSRFPGYLRSLLQAVYIEKTARISNIISKIDMCVLIKNEHLMKVPFAKLRSVDKQNKSETRSKNNDDGVLPTSNPCRGFRVPSQNIRKPSTRINSEKANSESHSAGKAESKRAGNLSESKKVKAMHTKKKKKEYEYEANKEDRLNNSLAKNFESNSKETENVVPGNTPTCKINLESMHQKGSDPIVNRLNESFIHLRGDNFPNNDSFIWKPVGKKKKSTCFQMFACDINGCNGMKKVRMFGNNRSFRKHSQSSNKIEVIYLQVHSCSSKIDEREESCGNETVEEPKEIETANDSGQVNDGETIEKPTALDDISTEDLDIVENVGNLNSSEQEDMDQGAQSLDDSGSSLPSPVYVSISMPIIPSPEAVQPSFLQGDTGDNIYEESKVESFFEIMIDNIVSDYPEGRVGGPSGGAVGQDVSPGLGQEDLLGDGDDSSITLDTCNICGEQFSTEGEVDAHVTTHIRSLDCVRTVDKKGQLYCIECNMNFSEISHLNYHTQLYHSTFKTIHQERLEILDKNLSEYPFVYWCKQCEYTAECRKQLEVHVDSCHEMFDQFNCNQCNYETDTILDLKHHIKFKHYRRETTKDSCVQCGFGPALRYNLELHMQQEHPPIFVCYMCDKSYSNIYEAKDMKENLRQKHEEFVNHLRTVHKLTDYYCHICGFETNSIKLFAIHEHTQQLLWQDMELIYVARSQEEKDDETFNFNDTECPDLNDSIISMDGLLENGDLDEIGNSDGKMNGGNLGTNFKEHEKNEVHALYVDFKVGTKYDKFKLIQLESYPTHKSKGIVTLGNIAVIICSESKVFNARGHFDCYDWGPSSGTRKLTKVNTYKCKQVHDGCFAMKKKWKCIGKCEFEGNFCCTYSMDDREAIVIVYINSHTHDVDIKETLSIDLLEKETAEEVIPEHSDTNLSMEEEDTKKCLNSVNVSTNSERTNVVLSEDLFEEELKLIKRNIKNYYPFSSVKETARQGIREQEMLDNFHIIRKEGPKVSEVAKDGYLYKRSHSNKNVPQLLSGKKQHLNVYTCEGILVCPNQECEIYKRVTHLNQVQNHGKQDRVCKHCPPNSQSEMVLEECHAKKWLLHSEDSPFVVVYYEANHTCGDQDWLLCPEVLDDLTNLFEDNTKLSGGNAFRLLFERKLRKINTNAPSEIKRQQMTDLMNVVRCCVHDYVPNNIRSAVRKSKCPKGMGIEAVVELQNILKDYYDDIGIILEVTIDSLICGKCKGIDFSYLDGEEISTKCKSCKIEMESRGPMVMLSSKEQIKLAWEMSKSDGVYSLATAFLDHQPGRTVNLTTMNCAVYDWNVQEMASLFLTHSQGEDRWSVCFALQYYDLVIKKYLGDEKYFHPYGFTTDNAGGLLCGIKAKFGDDISIRTCKFHYVYSAYQKCGDFIGSRSDKIVFLRFVYSLVDAVNASQFYAYSEKFKKWMKTKKSRNDGLSNWFEFWFNSRALWSSAFADLNLAQTNLVEGLQAKYSKKNGMKNLPLDQSVIYGVADAMLYQMRLVEAAKGKYKGHGPKKEILETRKLHEEMRRVKETAFTYEDLSEIFDMLGLPNDTAISNDEEENENEDDAEEIEANKSLLGNKRKLEAILNSPILNENAKRRKVLSENTFNEKSPHSFKEKKNPTKQSIKPLRKSGRPKGTKRKVYFSRHMDLSDVSEEASDDQFEQQMNILDNSFTSSIDKINMFCETEEGGNKRKCQENESVVFKKRKHGIDLGSKVGEKSREQNILDSGTFGSSLKSRYFSALKKAFRDRTQYEISHIHKQSFKVVKIWTGSGNKRVIGRFKNREETTYYVDFQNGEVICSCLDYVSIIAKNQDRICKHIASVLLKCNTGRFINFHGSRTYRKNSYLEVSEILSTFSKDREIVDPCGISMKPKETLEDFDDLEECPVDDWSTQDFDENPDTSNECSLNISEETPLRISVRALSNLQKGPFSHVHKALASASMNEWFVEIYFDSGSPRCRSVLCKKRIQKTDGCIRTDVFSTYTNRKTNEKYLCIDKMRFCINNECHKNADPTKLKYRKFSRMSDLNIQHLVKENRNAVRKYFSNSHVTIVD